MRDGAAGCLVLLAACHQAFGLDRVEPPDAPVDARVCAHGSAFGPSNPVPIDGAYSVEAARFAPDRSHAHLALCAASGDKDSCDLYDSVFDPSSGLFTQHDKLGAVSSSTAYDSYPTITPDGRYIIFSSQRDGATHNWVAGKTNGSFEMPALTRLNLPPTEHFSNEPYMLGDNQTLYFAATVASVGVDWDLYRAHGEPPGFGGTATRLEVVNMVTDEQAPVASNDELELFFSSNQHNGTGELDIFMATREDASQPFSTPTHLTNLSHPGGNDWPVWLSPDGCDLYYISKDATIATLYVTSR